jgi:hypothetical protein
MRPALRKFFSLLRALIITSNCSDVIRGGNYSVLPGAVGTAVKCSLRFDTVPNDFAFAVLANRSELVDRALEAVERMGLAGRDYLERQVIIVAAHFTSSH